MSETRRTVLDRRILNSLALELLEQNMARAEGISPHQEQMWLFLDYRSHLSGLMGMAFALRAVGQAALDSFKARLDKKLAQFPGL